MYAYIHLIERLLNRLSYMVYHIFRLDLCPFTQEEFYNGIMSIEGSPIEGGLSSLQYIYTKTQTCIHKGLGQVVPVIQCDRKIDCKDISVECFRIYKETYFGFSLDIRTPFQ